MMDDFEFAQAVTLSDGEKMVWAVAFVAALNGRSTLEHGSPLASSLAATAAYRAVLSMRFGVDLTKSTPEGDGMWLRMVGMNRSPDGKLYP